MELIDVIYNAIDVCVFIVFAGCLKAHRLKADLLTYVIATGSVAVLSVLEKLMMPNQDMYIDHGYLLLVLYGACLFMLICRDKELVKNIFCVVQFLAYSIAINLLFTYIAGAAVQMVELRRYEIKVIQIVWGIKSASLIGKIVLVMILGNISKNKKIAEYVDGVYILIASVCGLVTVYFYQGVSLLNMEFQVEDMILPILLLTLQILVLIVLARFSRLTSQKVESAVLRQQIESGEELYARIEENQNELRNVRHDLKNRLMGIYAALNEQGTTKEDIRKEMDDLLADIHSVEGYRYCNDTKVNSILYSKLSGCEQQGVKIKVELEYPRKLKISYGDLGVLLGNLLDNAIEACEYVPSEQRYITINGYSHINLWILRIENSCDSEAHSKGSISHGRGQKNVAELVKKYHGMIQSEKLDGKYVVEIQLTVY